MAETDTGFIAGSIDMIAALTILVSAVFPVRGDFLLYFGIIVILKAVWHYYRFPTWANPMGTIDLLSGVVIILLYFGISNSLFFVIGLVQLVKGGFAITSALTSGM
jgi:hypothetical protein